jgi:hypothetical protein
MNDKERILMHIIDGLQAAEILARPDARAAAWSIGDAAYKTDSGGQYVHFAPWVDDEDLQPGELVYCHTSRVNDFKIGFVVERLDYGRCMIREIGSDRVCDYGNERFIPIRGLSSIQLLEGEKYKFYVKVLKAFDRGDEYWYRFGGVEIENGKATITVRQRHGGFYRSGTKPFAVVVEWTPKTTIKAILEALRAGGYGTHEFELVNPDEAKPRDKSKGDG